MQMGHSGPLLTALALILTVAASAQKGEALPEPFVGKIDIYTLSPGLESLSGTDVHAGDSVILRAYMALDWQQNWTKRGVVVDVSGPGSPDSGTVSAPAVIFADGEYKMWYQSSNSTFPQSNILYANSTDGATWVKHGVVLGPGTPGSDNYVYYPYVLKQGTVFKMWYSGYSASDLSGIYRIFYATSSDGLNWNRQGLAIDVGPPGSYDDNFAYRPFVMFDGLYRMWYDGDDHSNIRILYATSPDGITWTKRGVSLDLGAPGSRQNVAVTSATILNESDGYHMWYRGLDGSTNRIFYATSADGISWTGRKMVLDVGPASTENRHLIFPSVLHLPGKPIQLWYAGRSLSASIDRIHYATLSPFALPAAVDVGFYLDNIAPANAIGINTTLVGALAQATPEMTWRALPLGHHFIYAVADPFNSIAEMNESNNAASIQINVTNRPPIADAGPNRAVFRNEVVTLDGTATSDPDGDSLAYNWVQTGGRPVGLIEPDAAAATLVPLFSGIYTFNLTVLDEWGGYSNDTVKVTVTNRQPIADAGPDQIATKRSIVTLDGTASSDPDGDLLSYSWLQTGGLPVILVGASTATPSFVPSSSGQYIFRLAVDDGDGGAAVGITRVNVTNANPVANGGTNQVARKNTVVTLDGTRSSDADGDSLSYSWTQTGGPAVTISGADRVIAAFTPPRKGTYAFRLTVLDGDGGSDSKTVIVNVTNARPVANAGQNLTLPKNTVILLSGNGSKDPDGDPLTFAWVQNGGPSVTLIGAGGATPRFIPTVSGVYAFELTVDDGDDGVSTSIVQIRVINAKPTARAGEDDSAMKKTLVTLDGSHSSDPDLDVLAFNWTQTVGPHVSLAGSNTAQPSFTASQVGTLVFLLTANDGDGGVDSDTVKITVWSRAPIPSLLADSSTVETGTTINFDASASVDQDGTITDFEFDYGDGTKANGTASTASHSYSTAGRYTVTLTVTDDDGNVSSIGVPIRINAPPTQPRDILADIWWLIIIIVVLIVLVVFLAYERRKWKGKARQAETRTVESSENPE